MSQAADQLRRLLAFLPQIGDGSEHRIADVARRVNVEPEAILRDLRDVSERWSDPPGWVEKIQFYIDADHISMGPSPHFRRPMRLSTNEWRAIELGLALMRAERAPDDRPVVEGTLEKVRELISQEPEGESPLGATLGAEQHAAAISTLREAIRECRRVEITYQKGGSEAADLRTICPFSFAVEQGVWYLVAHCDRSEAIRIFRLDRVQDLRVLNERFERAEGVNVDDLLREKRAFVGSPPEKLRVRYSPKVARWISERVQRSTNPDGSLEIEYPMADVSWAVRHVLQYGPEAEVIAPEEVRAAVIARLRELVSRHPTV